jgi:tRNA U34 5-methylaminomethyl-2-thiouridine-forming methyltransferase MnmC
VILSFFVAFIPTMHTSHKIIITNDNSPTLQHPITLETYHSMNGAMIEAQHVYYDAGTAWHLTQSPKPLLHLLEVGFGTGLNAILTLSQLTQLGVRCDYVALEPFPIAMGCIAAYSSQLTAAYPDISKTLLTQLHSTDLEIPIPEGHKLSKHRVLLENFHASQTFDVIYMDAFSPSTQPELWEPKILQNLAAMLAPGGHLVTYCAKGSVRRGFAAAGLEIERLQGPPGKREMLRARKPFLFSEGL